MGISVMGSSGAGKSYFINTILKANKMRVGTSLTSCTKELDFGHIENIEGYSSLKDHRIVLIDTPGFDDTHTASLRKIVTWLKKSYQNKEKLGGIVYLHDISQNRLNNTARQYIRIFQDMCGNDALKYVVFTTTCTKRTRDSEIADHLRELKAIHWKSLIEKGASVHRFDQGFESAWAIIDSILSTIEKLGQNGTILQIQKDMHEGKTTYDAFAGKYAVFQKPR
ncbi:hypothetical protein GALMADRAFT_77162 [Galerina marginata CBS 339.88]|uniref:AIG1-type G domain-containing protein n=1 Tax=Galerina marginata (strain CBS 339.88) TaxID=685588 RepID=A0A067SFX2_GALM3|nr:hypothetical protein GALMADRAFT_77162 [Galerina marginata CBS 339.88]